MMYLCDMRYGNHWSGRQDLNEVLKCGYRWQHREIDGRYALSMIRLDREVMSC